MRAGQLPTRERTDFRSRPHRSVQPQGRAESITGVTFLSWIAGALGIAGIAFALLGALAPTALHSC